MMIPDSAELLMDDWLKAAINVEGGMLTRQLTH